ncbi:hypothetical protein ACH5RR_005738 [Cinchona calisaya]|uniref:Uncharacterized protein n=1 Tax=Cinchona calisaya TaxID=153742 RepID=A0ABD3ALY7_9GENT
MRASFKERRASRKVRGSDKISYLPNHVIDIILTYVPLKDAARTSILSHQWRYKWVNLSTLVFDNTFGRVRNLVSSRYKLLMNIFQVLLVHDGPIYEFVLSVPGLESCLEIDQYLNFVSKKGVQNIILQIWKGKPHVLPQSLFSCLQLIHLSLCCCVLNKPPPAFRGFSKLVYLILREVAIDAEKLSSLIGKCPLLEHFTIESSRSYDYLEVGAPNLKFLHCNAQFENVIYVTTPLLANISMSLKVLRNEEAFEEEWTLLELLGCHSVIEDLHLDYYYLKSWLKGGACFSLDHLKVLKLSAICFGMTNEVTCAHLLISNCPNLQKLAFEAYSSQEGLTVHDVEFYVELHQKDLSSCQVRELEMLNISVSWPELEFIKIMLSKLLKLEKMLIAPNFKTVADGGFNLLKEVAKFQRASPKAVIKFKDW